MRFVLERNFGLEGTLAYKYAYKKKNSYSTYQYFWFSVFYETLVLT